MTPSFRFPCNHCSPGESACPAIKQGASRARSRRFGAASGNFGRSLLMLARVSALSAVLIANVEEDLSLQGGAPAKCDFAEPPLDSAQRAERERERRNSRLTESFASTVSVAARAASESPDGVLPQSVLAALLEDPAHMLSGTPCQNNTYEEVPVLWQQLGAVPCSASVLRGMQHETSQLFARSLSFGRRRCFRLHRFRLGGESALAMTSALSQLALQRAISDPARFSEEGAIRGSNVGGFQQLLASDSALAHELRSAFIGAIRQVAAADRARVLEEEPSVTPPVSPRCDAFAAWMNVLSKV